MTNQRSIVEQVALITDTHAGVRNDSPVFAENQQAFYEKIFFPECEARGITRVIHLGDYFDRRKYINFKSLYWNRNMFVKPLLAKNMSMELIIGNHDVAMKNTNEINSPELLLSMFGANLKVIREPTVTSIGGIDVALIPWINNENYSKTMKYIKDVKASMCFGHFEFKGFEMHAGAVCEEGMGIEAFSKFKEVYSGHFHKRSRRGNVEYLGAASEYTWSDYNDERGFHILKVYDDGSYEKEFVQNTEKMFYRFSYDDTEELPTIEDVLGDKNLVLKDKVVKLVITGKKNPYRLDLFIEHLVKMQPYDLQIVDVVDITSTNLTDEEKEQEMKDTIHILCDHVDGMSKVETDTRNSIKALFRDLYAQALQENDA